MSQPVVPVILSGGTGTRLWPLSREQHPKQFISLLGGYTLLQATVRRLQSLEKALPPIVVCNEAHRFLVAEQLRAVDVPPAAILLEPTARNTAPAIAAAAFEATARFGQGEDPILLVLPADHVIREDSRFADAVRTAIEEAAGGRLVTFGVVPTHVETGYGYIKAGPPTGPDRDARLVENFIEKPNADAAHAYIKAGDCYWNSGMFVFGARRFLDDLGIHALSIRQAVHEAHRNATPDLGFLRLDAEAFTQAPARSVDHAVMEQTSNAVVIPLDAGWSDIGSWANVSSLFEHDDAGNILQGDAIVQNTNDSFIRSGDRMVAAVGVRNLVIIDTSDAVLVLDKDSAQDVKSLVERLERAGRDHHKNHRKVHRPWGSYDSVHAGDGFKVKHITVQPGQKLSLQAHRRRAEHWIVIRGVARVTRDGEVFTVTENQSTYIPQGAKHRLENPGSVPLELIEVQMGSYLGEDDIVRFEDAYGRVSPQDEPSRSESTPSPSDPKR